MCIVQDDQTSKSYWIHEMAAVYAGAVVTIVAAAGVDSSAGLPGVRRGTRLYPQIAEEVIPGLTLATLSSQTTLVEDSKYSSRGWTFQERMLSTRNLVFLPNEAFFECRQAVFVEEVACEDASFSYNEHDQIYDLGVLSPFKRLAERSDDYSELVEMYSSRCFSNESDALNAFAGMLRVLSLEMRSHFICGHPIEDFGETLLWTLDRDEVHNGTRRKGFPSWAWSGWTGEKRISNPPWVGESTESDESGLSDVGEGDSVRSSIWWRAEVQDDCYQISPPTHSLQEALQTCLDGEQLVTFDQPDYSCLPHLPRYSDTLQQVRLRFWTIIAPFSLSRKSMPFIMDPDSEPESDGFDGSSVSIAAPRFFSIWGENDTWCGEVVDCCADVC